MTASYILEKVNAIRPNPYGSYLGDYLKSLDMRIRTDILKEVSPVYSENSLALCENDFSVYELFLFSVIDLLNGEYGRFENSKSAFDAAYSALASRYAESTDSTEDMPDDSPDTYPELYTERRFKIW